MASPKPSDQPDAAAIADTTTFPIVGVGASAGGLEAFAELLRHVPAGTGVAFVLIQHLDPTHPSYLAEALGRSTSFPVLEIKDGVRVEPDHVYVIPSNADIGILRRTLALLPRPFLPLAPLPFPFALRSTNTRYWAPPRSFASRTRNW